MLSLLLPCAFSCCLLEMEVSSKVPSDVLVPSLLKVMLKVMEALAVPLSLPSQLLSCSSLLKKAAQYWVLKVGWCVLWNSGTLSDCPPLMIPALGVRDLHSCSMAFYWNSLLWISSLLFFCLQIHHFNIWESSICSSSTRAFHFLQRNKQCLALQALTFQDFP